jgi:hypothetical protein
VGQSNVWYPLDAFGQPKRARWIERLRRYVDSYGGENLLAEPDVDAGADAAQNTQAVLDGITGQGFAGTAEHRAAVEDHAMRYALRHLSQKFGSANVRDVCRSQSYDIECTTPTGRLLVEVKGTIGDGRSVVITHAEDRLRKRRKVALFLLHSIRLSKNRASGGKAVLLNPQQFARASVVPITLNCRLASPRS